MGINVQIGHSTEVSFHCEINRLAGAFSYYGNLCIIKREMAITSNCESTQISCHFGSEEPTAIARHLYHS